MRNIKSLKTIISIDKNLYNLINATKTLIHAFKAIICNKENLTTNYFLILHYQLRGIVNENKEFFWRLFKCIFK